MTRIGVIHNHENKESFKSLFPYDGPSLFYYPQDQVIPKTCADVHGRNKMDELPSIRKEIPSKAKVVLFYKNGDRNARGFHVTVNPRRFQNLDNLLSELTRITNLPHGVRFIFTPFTGTKVESLGQLVDGQAYVCGSYPKFKRINYMYTTYAPGRKKHVDEKSHIPSHHNGNRLEAGTTINPGQPARAIKPKIITIVRNGVNKPKKSARILLNKRTAQTYDQVLNDITGAVGVEGGCVRKLYNIEGKLVESLSELFSDNLVFIAVGNERFRSCDIPHIIQYFATKNAGSGINASPITTNNKIKKLSRLKPIQKSTDHHDESSEPLKHSAPSHKKLPVLNMGFRTASDSNIDNCSIIPTIKSPINLMSKSNISINKKTPLPSIPISTTSQTNDPKEPMNYSTAVITNGSHHDIKGDKTVDVICNKLPVKFNSKEELDINDLNNNLNTNNTLVEIKSNGESVKGEFGINDNPTDNGTLVDPSTNIPDITDNKREIANELLSTEIQSTGHIKRYISHQLEASEDISKFFEVGKILGDGNFAVVKSAKDKHNSIMYALKIIDTSKICGKEQLLRNEILIQRETSHPNIVQLIHDFHSPTEIFLAMELITGGDFFDHIAKNVKLEEDQASRYTKDMCCGLDYLHERSIVHRDIKPENLMVHIASNGSTSLKIADFGLAQKVIKPIFTVCGTPTYVSPEILKEEGYGVEVDIWAAGVIIYIMLCGFPPFRSPNRKQSELFELIERSEFEFLEPFWENISYSAKDLIRNILVADVKQRFTCKDILRHPWLTQNNFVKGITMNVVPRQLKVVAQGIRGIERMKKSISGKNERGEKFLDNSNEI